MKLPQDSSTTCLWGAPGRWAALLQLSFSVGSAVATFREGLLEPPKMLRPHSSQDFSCVAAMVYGYEVPVKCAVSTEARQTCRDSHSTSTPEAPYLHFAPHNSFARVDVGGKASNMTYNQQQKLQQRVAQSMTFPRSFTSSRGARLFDGKLLATPTEGELFH